MTFEDLRRSFYGDKSQATLDKLSGEAASDTLTNARPSLADPTGSAKEASQSVGLAASQLYCAGIRRALLLPHA